MGIERTGTENRGSERTATERTATARTAPALALTALAALDGVVAAGAQEPVACAPLAFVGGAATLLALRSLTLRWAVVAAYAHGVAYAVAVAPWVYVALREHYQIGVVGSVLFELGIVGGGVGLYIGTPLLIARWMCGAGQDERVSALWRVGLPPALVFVFEWLRSVGPVSMPWGLLGSGAAASALTRQAADVIGVLGLSLCSMLFASALAEVAARVRAAPAGARWVELRRGPAWIAVGLVSALMGYGAVRRADVAATLARETARDPHGVHVAAVQASILQPERWDEARVEQNFALQLALSRDAVTESGAEIVVWPETAVADYVDARSSRYRLALQAFVTDHDVDVIVGGPRFERDEGPVRFYNALFHFGPGSAAVAHYDKIQLLAFAEFNPLFAAPFLPATGTSPRIYSAGDRAAPFELGTLVAGPMICFEALYPWIAREQVRRGAELLVNASNDAWFQRTQAAAQHLAQARLRAVEHRRYLIRSTGTGISAIVDPLGEDVVPPLGLFERGVLSGRVHGRTELTFYGAVGDLPLLVSTAAFVAAAGVARVRRRHRPRGACAGSGDEISSS